LVKNDKYYLISTDDYFVGPDNQQYRAVWGKVKVCLVKDEFDFHPTHSTNWFVKVGEGEGAIMIGGCQISFAIELSRKPDIELGKYESKDSGEMLVYNKIYIPGEI